MMAEIYNKRMLLTFKDTNGKGYRIDADSANKSITFANEIGSESYFYTGSLSSLTTTDKSSLVAAVNEVNSKMIKYHNTHEDSIDLDNLIATGIYSIDGKKVSGTLPYALTGGTSVIIIIYGNKNYPQQKIIDGYNGKISIRSKMYVSSEVLWGNWKTFL